MLKRLPLIILAFAFSGLLTFLILKKTGNAVSETSSSSAAKVPTLSVKYEESDKKVNFLLLGYGGAGHDGGSLSDVLMLVSIDNLNKQVTLISIPRDLWVSVPIRSDQKQNFKVNAAYAIGRDDRGYPLKEPVYKGQMGGGNLAKKVVSDALGIKINYFAAVDFESFKNIIDVLGGVDVEVPKTFDDYFYPVKGKENETCGFSASEITDFHQKYSGFELEKQFTCRYEHLHFEKGSVKMNGETALKFVRSRHSNEYGGDFARGERQNAVLYAAKDKLFSIYAAKNAEELYKQFQNLVTTDLDIQSFKVFTNVLGVPEDYKIKHVGLSTENVLTATKSFNGQFILIPKEGENVWENVQKYVYDQINSS